MSNEKRFCPPFNMTPQQFYDYQLSKKTRILWYIFLMIVISIFNDRWTGYVFLTIWLIGSYWVDAKREEQWKKDGQAKKEDFM